MMCIGDWKMEEVNPEINFPRHSYYYIELKALALAIGAHLVTEEVTPVGSVKFDRLIELTVWPGCSVALSKVNWRVTFKNCLRSFHIWIVLQLQINTASLTLIKSLVRSFQFCWYFWVSRGKHFWWSPK